MDTQKDSLESEDESIL